MDDHYFEQVCRAKDELGFTGAFLEQFYTGNEDTRVVRDAYGSSRCLLGLHREN